MFWWSKSVSSLRRYIDIYIGNRRIVSILGTMALKIVSVLDPIMQNSIYFRYYDFDRY